MDFNEWANKKRQQFSDVQNVEQEKELEVRDIITRKTITFTSDDLSFDTPSRLLPKHYRALANIQKLTETKSLDDYDVLQGEMANFMASIVIDKSMDKEFWISYDEETGGLQYAIHAVIEKLSSVPDSVKTFRTH